MNDAIKWARTLPGCWEAANLPPWCQAPYPPRAWVMWIQTRPLY